MQVFFGADGVTVCLRNKQPRPHFKETVERLMGKGFEVALWTYCFPYAYQMILREMSLRIPVLTKSPQTLPSAPHIIVDALKDGVPVNSNSRILLVPPFIEWKGNDTGLLKVSWEICEAGCEVIFWTGGNITHYKELLDGIFPEGVTVIEKEAGKLPDEKHIIIDDFPLVAPKEPVHHTGRGRLVFRRGCRLRASHSGKDRRDDS